MAGGDSDPAIVAGKVAESLLMERLESGEMPPGEKKVSAEEIAVIATGFLRSGPGDLPVPSRAAADKAFDLFLNTFEEKYLQATQCLAKDRDELLTF